MSGFEGFKRETNRDHLKLYEYESDPQSRTTVDKTCRKNNDDMVCEGQRTKIEHTADGLIYKRWAINADGSETLEHEETW